MPWVIRTMIRMQSWVFWILLVTGFTLGAIHVFLDIINPDVVWLLQVATRVMDGEVLYRDVIEINPPLIVWLSCLPVLLARALGISVILAFRLLVLLSIAGSLGLSGWLLRRAVPDRPVLCRGLLLILLFGLLPLANLCFGEREHLLIILLAPYLFAAAGRASGPPEGGLDRRLGWLVGTLAGVGIALKPYFVPIWLLVEGYLLWTRPRAQLWRRPENLAVILVGALYVGAVVGFAPAYLELARQAQPIYAEFARKPLSFFLVRPEMICAWCALMGFVLVRPRGGLRDLCWVILLAEVGLLVGTLAQQKGFTNHFYLVTAINLLLLGVLVGEARSHDEPFFRFTGLLFGGLLLAVVIRASVDVVQLAEQWRGDPAESATPIGQLARLTQEHARGDNVYFLSVNGDTFTFLFYTDARWKPKYNHLWPLPGLYAYQVKKGETVVFHSAAEISELERDMFESTIHALQQQRPALLFVEDWLWPNGKFDLLEYFRRDCRFADFIRDYEFLTVVDRLRIYRRRVHPAAAVSPTEAASRGAARTWTCR